MNILLVCEMGTLYFNKPLESSLCLLGKRVCLVWSVGAVGLETSVIIRVVIYLKVQAVSLVGDIYLCSTRVTPAKSQF